jgi:hydrogenase expression/formation protein HypE
MSDFVTSCPAPLGQYTSVLLAHGGGGRLMHQLLERVFVEAFRNPLLETRHDAAVLDLGSARVAFTTDSYVVRPLFFPGGDIGTLAVNGTVNDLAMAGAHPRYLSAGFIIEEGFAVETLQRVVASMRDAALAAGVQIVTGDTKVVDRGKGDGVFINTAGVGTVAHELCIQPSAVRAGDAVILSGDIGRHGMAIMAVREGIAFETRIESDSASLLPLVDRLREAFGPDVHVLRDPTRGGVASTLNEIAAASGVGVELEEAAIPVPSDVSAACEMLGLDPLYVANEGVLVALLPESLTEAALASLREHPMGAAAVRVGKVVAGHPGLVVLRTAIGGSRIVDQLPGDQLPRIC